MMVAEAARQDCSLEKVLFIPAGSHPFKDDKYIADSIYRFEMTRLAIESNPYFDISDIEVERQGISYTVDTLKMLRQIYASDYELWMIIGGDAFLEIETWKDSYEIMTMCNLAVYMRFGYPEDQCYAKAESLAKKVNTNIIFLDAPKVDISSTDIRSRVEQGKSIRYMVPEVVEDYIRINKIYS